MPERKKEMEEIRLDFEEKTEASAVIRRLTAYSDRFLKLAEQKKDKEEQ